MGSHYVVGRIDNLKLLKFQNFFHTQADHAVADPGFPVGGVHPLGGHGPPTWALFGVNVCENERIGSHRGWRARGTPPPPPQIRQ